MKNSKRNLMVTLFLVVLSCSVLPGCLGHGWGCGPIRARIGGC